MRRDIFCIGIALIGLAGCPTAEDTTPEFVGPDTWGPHGVGTERHETTARDGSPLSVQVWFPAAEGSGTPTYEYEPYVEEFGTDVVGSAMTGAEPDCGEVRPLIAFSHGHGGTRYQNFSLGELAASHGYVTVAPDHPGDTWFDWQLAVTPGIALRRPHDVADAVDHLVDELGAGDLQGCVASDPTYAMVGHSFGGYTTLAVAGAPLHMEGIAEECAADDADGCDQVLQWVEEHPGETHDDRSDPRVIAAAAYTPGAMAFLGDDLSAIVAPAMMVGGDMDTVTPWESHLVEPFGTLTATPRYLAQIQGAGHFTFCDLCDFLPDPPFNGCASQYADFEDVLGTTHAATLAMVMVLGGEERARDWLPPDDGFGYFEEID